MNSKRTINWSRRVVFATMALLCLPASRSPAQETLTLALKSESIETLGTIERAFELAKRISDEATTPAFSYKSVTGVRFINRSDYDLLWDPFPTNEEAPTTKVQGLAPRSTDVRVAKDPFSYVIHSAEGSVVDALELKYAENDTGEQRKVTLEKAGERAVDGPLTMIMPGAYHVTLDSKWQPLEYRVKFSKVNGRTATNDNEWSDKAVWPGSKTKYFLVKLDGFQGDPKQILEVIRSEEFLDIETYEITKRISYAAADLDVGTTSTGTSCGISDEGLTIDIPVPAEARITRVWALLPVDEEDKENAIKMLKSWDDSDGFEMRKSMDDAALNKYGIVMPPANPSQKTTLGAAEPQWLVIEPIDRNVPPKGTVRYQRRFKLSSEDAWTKRLSKARELILMFERDPGRGDRFKLFVEDADSGYWQVDEMRISVKD